MMSLALATGISGRIGRAKKLTVVRPKKLRLVGMLLNAVLKQTK
jgi:hypothetical protein